MLAPITRKGTDTIMTKGLIQLKKPSEKENNN